MRTIIAVSLFGLASLAIGCDDPPRLPTGPTSPRPLPEAVTRVTGEVTDERGHAVSGATVFAYGVGTVVTDSDGRYALDVPPGVGHLETKVEKSGYEKNEQYWLPVRASQSFVLRDVIRIAAGESRQVDVGPADSQFGFEYEYRTRTIRVTSVREVNVELEVVPNDGRPTEGLALGDFLNYPCCPARTSVSMRAGQEILAQVLISWTTSSPRTVTLTTRIVPQP